MKKLAKKLKLRYLAYLVVVTTMITSTTLARFASQDNIGVSGVVAAFVSDTTLDLELGTQGALSPGESRSISFIVTNESGGTISEVPLGYSLQLETTGNLPLVFSLQGEKTAEDDESSLVGNLDGNLCAEGGTLPSARSYGACSHSYTLTLSWPQDKNAEEYSHEIDRLSVKIKTEQQAAAS